MSLKLEKYKESGRVDFTGILLLLISMLLTSVVLGFAYAYAIHYIPVVYFNIACVMGVGYIISGVMKRVSKYGKVRNRIITTGVSFITAILTVYIQWIVWLKIVFEGELFWKPLDVYNAILYVLPYGTWSIGTSDINGVLLGAVWVAEACTIIGIPLFTSKIEELYCEECNSWVDNEKYIKYSLTSNLESIKKEFEHGNFEVLNTIEKLDADYCESHILLKFGICSECSGLAYASLNNVTIEYNKKGEMKNKNKALVKTVVISKQKYNELLSV